LIQEPPRQSHSSAGGVFGLVLGLLLLLTAVLVVVSFPVGVYTVFFTSLSSKFSAASVVQGVYVFVGPVPAILPLAGSMGGFFVGLSVIYAAMVVLAARQGRGMLSSLRASVREGVGPLFSNTFFVTLISIGFLGFAILVIDSLETSRGVPVGSLSGDAMQLFMSLTIAPLREELGFRMIMVGIPALALCLGRSWTLALKSLWRPSVCYEGDVNATYSQAVLALAAAVSSVSFGLVHVLSGAGWEIGKLPEAAFAGVVLAYVYIRYGFHVAVLTHWGIDYLDSVFAFFGQGAYGIPWTADNGYVLQQVVALDLVAFLGLASFLAVCYLGLKGWFKRPAAAAAPLGGQP
jgi:hypothetical protein